MKLYILEPSAIQLDRTHNLISLLNYSYYFSKRNITISWVTNARCKYIHNNIDNYSLFNYTMYDKNNRYKQSKFPKLIRALDKVSFIKTKYTIKKTEKSIQSLFKQALISGNDHFFIPTTDWIILNSIVNCIKYIDIKNCPSLHFLFMYREASWMTGGYPYSQMIKMLTTSSQFKKKIYIYTETKKHAEILSKTLGTKIHHIPFPSFPVTTSKHNPRRKKIVICSLGGGRRDKGFDKLSLIVSDFLKRYQHSENIQFVFQKPRNQDHLEESLSQLLTFKNVKILNNQLSNTEYEERLVSSDIFLFPYHKNTYFLRGSGIVWEAVANSKPLVCTKGTALEEALICENGLSAETISDFSKALIKIINSLSHYKKNAEICSEHYYKNMINNPMIRKIIANSDTKSHRA